MTEDTRKFRRREDKGNIKCRFMLSGIKRDGRKMAGSRRNYR